MRNVAAAALQLAVPAGAATFSTVYEEIAETTIKIDSFTFAPQYISVDASTTVTWHNEDDIPHIIASKTDLFRSSMLNTDGKFSFEFLTPGSYAYYCALHPQMIGTIVVGLPTRKTAP
jgi:plastocyanin